MKFIRKKLITTHALCTVFDAESDTLAKVTVSFSGNYADSANLAEIAKREAKKMGITVLKVDAASTYTTAETYRIPFDTFIAYAERVDDEDTDE